MLKKIFILTHAETGEKIRITLEQLQDDQGASWPAPRSLFDVWVEEIETEPDRNEDVQVEVEA